MQKDMPKINTITIENAVDSLIKQQNGKFNVSDVIDYLKADDEEGKIFERILNSLQIDSKFFHEEDTFYLKHKFFSGKSFLITPTEREIKEKILIPGHRFSAFVSPENFPSEVTFIEKISKQPSKTKVIKDSIDELFAYHFLMGAEQISDFFIAENPKNEDFQKVSRENSKLYLNVFDLKEFYKANKFQVGDALLCKIKNYDQGIVEFQYLSGELRTTKNIDKFVKSYNSALFDVIDLFENYLELTEQFSWAFFIGRNNNLFGSKIASLDEFIKKATDLEITLDDGHAVLIRSSKDKDFEFENFDSDTMSKNSENSSDIPEDFGISSGAIGSMEDILRDIGSTLTPVEIDAYILENHSMRNHDFGDFFNRTFNKEALAFADEAQEMVFLNYLDERFETLHSSYDIVADESKANLRSLILEIISSRNEFFDHLKMSEFDENKLPNDEMKKIAEASIHLNNILKLINDFGYEVNEDDNAAMEKSIEKMELILEKAMEKIETFVATNS